MIEANISIFCRFRKSKVAKKRKVYTKRPPRPPTFKCTIRQCAEEFTNKDDLIAHKIATHKRIQCTHCPDLKLVLDLNTHLKNMHGIIQNTICEHCGQGNATPTIWLLSSLWKLCLFLFFSKFFKATLRFWVMSKVCMRCTNHYNVIFAKIGLKVETVSDRIWLMCTFKGRKPVKFVEKYRRTANRC